MSNTVLTAYLGISTHYAEPSVEDLYSVLDELCALSGQLALPMYEYGTSKPTIELVDSSQTNRSEFIVDWPSQLEILSITVKAPVTGKIQVEYFDGEIRVLEGAQATEYNKVLSRGRFTKRIWDIITVGNIACIGILNPVRSVIIQDENLCRDLGGHIGVDVLWDAYNIATEIGWPNLKRVDFARAWEWAIKQEGFLGGFGDSPVSRALNAFTQVLRADVYYEPMQLFWALMGIEALYVKGNVALMQQLREKSQTFLGPQEALKKRISQMYDFRSRFIHGDLAFPGYPLIFDGDERVQRHYEQLGESISLAVAILVATIQELMQRGWSGLDFSYKVDDIST